MIPSVSLVVFSVVLKPPPSQDAAIAQGIAALAFLVIGVGVVAYIAATVHQRRKRKEQREQLVAKAAPAGFVFIDKQTTNYRKWALPFSKDYYSEALNLVYKIDDEGLLNIAFVQAPAPSDSEEVAKAASPRAVYGIYVGGKIPRLSVYPDRSIFFKKGNLDLDSSEFNDTFVVEAADEKTATAFLHPEMMEYVLRKSKLHVGESMSGFHIENGWLVALGTIEDVFLGGRAYSWGSVNAHLNYLREIIELIPAWLIKDAGMELSRASGYYSPLSELFPGILNEVPKTSPTRREGSDWGNGEEDARAITANPRPAMANGALAGLIAGGVAGGLASFLMEYTLKINIVSGLGAALGALIGAGVGVAIALRLRKK